MEMEDKEREAALRPLRKIGGAVSALRGGALAPAEQRQGVIQVAAATEASLRRLLRDFPAAALEVRLRALDSDELRADEVLAELRQHDRISMGLAASVHDLFEARRRLAHQGELLPGDGPLAARVAEELEREVQRPVYAAPPPPAAPLPPPAAVAGDETLLHPAAADAPRRRRPARWQWAAGALALVALVGLGLWLLMPRDRSQLDQGIALFRSGSYQDAASFFWRYAEANPDDATPHLYLARIHRRMGRTDMAADELRKATELAPDDVDVITETGFLALDTRRYDAAVERFRAAIRIDGEAEAAWVGLVRAVRASGNPLAAERVLASAPAEVRALFAERAPAADSL